MVLPRGCENIKNCHFSHLRLSTFRIQVCPLCCQFASPDVTPNVCLPLIGQFFTISCLFS